MDQLSVKRPTGCRAFLRLQIVVLLSLGMLLSSSLLSGQVWKQIGKEVQRQAQGRTQTQTRQESQSQQQSQAQTGAGTGNDSTASSSAVASAEGSARTYICSAGAFPNGKMVMYLTDIFAASLTDGPYVISDQALRVRIEAAYASYLVTSQNVRAETHCVHPSPGDTFQSYSRKQEAFNREQVKSAATYPVLTRIIHVDWKYGDPIPGAAAASSSASTPSSTGTSAQNSPQRNITSGATSGAAGNTRDIAARFERYHGGDTPGTAEVHAGASVTCTSATSDMVKPDVAPICYILAPGYRGSLGPGETTIVRFPGTVTLQCHGMADKILNCSARIREGSDAGPAAAAGNPGRGVTTSLVSYSSPAPPQGGGKAGAYVNGQRIPPSADGSAYMFCFTGGVNNTMYYTDIFPLTIQQRRQGEPAQAEHIGRAFYAYLVGKRLAPPSVSGEPPRMAQCEIRPNEQAAIAYKQQCQSNPYDRKFETHWNGSGSALQPSGSQKDAVGFMFCQCHGKADNTDYFAGVFPTSVQVNPERPDMGGGFLPAGTAFAQFLVSRGLADDTHRRADCYVSPREDEATKEMQKAEQSRRAINHQIIKVDWTYK